jgi:hypothetical protein
LNCISSRCLLVLIKVCPLLCRKSPEPDDEMKWLESQVTQMSVQERREHALREAEERHRQEEAKLRRSMEKPDFQSGNLFSKMLDRDRTSVAVPGRKAVSNAAQDTFSFATADAQECPPESSRGRRRNDCSDGRSQISFSPNDADRGGGVQVKRRGAGEHAPPSRRPESIIPDHGHSHIGVSVIPGWFPLFLTRPFPFLSFWKKKPIPDTIRHGPNECCICFCRPW